MRKTFLFLVLVIAFVLACTSAFAKRAPSPVGSIDKFCSVNGEYCVEIKILGYPDSSPSECSFKKGNDTFWQKQIPTTPGLVNITDDGKYIILANWGWFDEGGYKSISIYSGDGVFLREIFFGENSTRDGMFWAWGATISKDNKYYIFSVGQKEEFILDLNNCLDAPLIRKFNQK